jgi:peptidoglycan/xylan/chitin deacetylase (PgdA/CDA1 family)
MAPWSLRSMVRHAVALGWLVYLRCSPRRVGVALCYHAVEPQEGDPRRRLVAPIALDAFRRQMRHLRRWYRVVPASALPDEVRRRARWGRVPVAVTFDDDLASHATHAAPVLARLGLTATFFLTGAAVDQPARFWWQMLQTAWDRDLLTANVLGSWDLAFPDDEPSLRDVAAAIQAMEPGRRDAVTEALRVLVPDSAEAMTLGREDIVGLARQGFEIGFHTRRHDDLLGLGADELKEAMTAGRSELEAAAGAPARVISYPHGRADQRVAQCAAVAGFTAGYTADGTAISPDTPVHLLGRRYPARGPIGAFCLDVVRTLAGGQSAASARSNPIAT